MHFVVHPRTEEYEPDHSPEPIAVCEAPGKEGAQLFMTGKRSRGVLSSADQRLKMKFKMAEPIRAAVGVDEGDVALLRLKR